MPSNNDPKASNADARDYSNFEWVSGANARFDAMCISTALDGSGRIYLGIKGWDKKHGKPGFIQIEMTPSGLQDGASLLQRAALQALTTATEERRKVPVATGPAAAALLATMVMAAFTGLGLLGGLAF